MLCHHDDKDEIEKESYASLLKFSAERPLTPLERKRVSKAHLVVLGPVLGENAWTHLAHLSSSLKSGSYSGT